MDRLSGIGFGQPINWVAPIPALRTPFQGPVAGLDMVSLDGEMSDAEFFRRMDQMAAMRFGYTPPQQQQGPTFNPYAPPTPGSNADFFQQMRDLKQQALREAAQRGRTPNQGKDPKKGQAEGGRINVTADSKWDSEGKEIPVTKISIHESGNWKNRDVETYWNSGGNYERSNSFDHKTKPGAWYQITVTWADGSTKTLDRQMPASGDLNENIDRGW